MADVQDVNLPYELLVRYGADGTPAGAQVQYLRRITIDGTVVKEDVQPAQPIDLANFPTTAIMTDTCRDALATVSTQATQIATLTGQLTTATDNGTQLQTELTAANATIGDLRVQLAAAQKTADAQSASDQGQITLLTAQLAAANATIEQLQSTLRSTQSA